VEIVDETCGVLVPPGDAKGLAGTLRQLIEDADSRRRLGEQGPARARDLCDPARQFGALEATLRRAVTGTVPATMIHAG
jgi:hypothetical protein